VEAYVERFSGGLVRVGAARHGEPYLYSVTYDDAGEYAEIKGFYQRHIPRMEFELVVSRINEASGKLVCYQRIGQARTVQMDPASVCGKIVMKKEI
jgi:hypothetical protein